MSAQAAHAGRQETTGGWVLVCPDNNSGHKTCVLRLDRPLFGQGSVSADLEIRADGRSLVPVIVASGLPGELVAAASMTGRPDVSVWFDDGKPEPLDCAPTQAGYLCAPGPGADVRLSAALPAARSVTVRASLTAPGLKPLPSRDTSFALSGTRAALDRLRAAGPAPVPGALDALASGSPADLMGLADKALRAAGFQDGVPGLVAKYRGQ